MQRQEDRTARESWSRGWGWGWCVQGVGERGGGLGSQDGFDCLLAAETVSPSSRSALGHWGTAPIPQHVGALLPRSECHCVSAGPGWWQDSTSPGSPPPPHHHPTHPGPATSLPVGATGPELDPSKCWVHNTLSVHGWPLLCVQIRLSVKHSGHLPANLRTRASTGSKYLCLPASPQFRVTALLTFVRFKWLVPLLFKNNFISHVYAQTKDCFVFIVFYLI